ncbi:hypothetical protein OGAPHI_003018 [Ogataea philodendri]|uniref:ATP-dependent 6-phosphofructokinase n=1 Tax=Ogataea philodendri TaxID=1378263 RepID=A0A9P8T6G4_9ASCO|nr:uncharacterized protein OGAPHI_003018 [Ogataea philodendri]KAH3667369.1 hypothetical protein OGAPHI_003018 [Ogataea philodendri]
MSFISSFNFSSFTASKTQDYVSLIQFYKSFGLSVIKTFSKDANSSGSELVGISSDSRRECWLSSFPLTRAVGHGVSGAFNKGAMIKLRLVSHDVHRNIEVPGEIVFFTVDPAKIRAICEQNNYTIEQGDSKVEFFVVDPLGNRIGFTQYPSAVAKEKVSTVEDLVAENPAAVSPVAKQNTDKKRIAVMTSGGDSPGMCAVVRAVVRAGIYYDCEVYGCYEGYSGLVQGGSLLKKLDWEDVRGWLSLGGTLIGTARCMEFKERWGRLKAAKNMIVEGIDALVVCGGDGSLTGADLFRSEWPSLLEELVATGEISTEQRAKYQYLTIVGLVGSIDNDMALTDSTIGAYSSLERICEMVDYIDSTAASHSRAFVVEVMGRHCGWLALMAGISCGADHIFIPERPHKAGSWRDELKRVCSRHREKGRRKTTVIVAEGALDDELNPITSNQVKDCLVEIGLDTRITTLGHVQRGGTAVAFDRMLATLQGVDAVRAVLENTPETPSPMIGILDGKIVRKPLMEAVKLTKSVSSSIAAKKFDEAMAQRDSTFKESYANFLDISEHDDGSQVLDASKRLNIAIIHVGAPTAALNPATRAAALYCLSRGHTPYGVQNGWSGLVRHGALKKLDWMDVEEWHNIGGSELGTNRTLPSTDMGTVAYYLQKYEIQGLIIIGGFEAFRSLYELNRAKKEYPIFHMPMVCLPATVSNNVPGTEYSLGSDTCLNTLVNYCDAVKQSASATRRRVFVVEVQGGNSGYIASYTGLVTGALAVYTPEKKISLRSLQEDLELLEKNFEKDQGNNRSGKMFIRNEKASDTYTTDLIAEIIKESGHGKFESRTAIPGHVQQGKVPSAMDRCHAARFAIKACQYIEERNFSAQVAIETFWKEGFGSNLTSKGHSEADLKFVYKHGKKYVILQDNAKVIGIHGSNVIFEDIDRLWEHDTDLDQRKGKQVHWSTMIEVNDLLSGRSVLRDTRRL